MIFKTLSIQNFGLFCGSHEFDLEPRTKYRKTSPIILFGGKNGAGKTTFLEAILLCLYGKNALDRRMSNRDYCKYISGRIHRPRGGGGVKLKNASIQLAFFLRQVWRTAPLYCKKSLEKIGLSERRDRRTIDT